jgi:phage tail tape-measure protein
MRKSLIAISLIAGAFIALPSFANAQDAAAGAATGAAVGAGTGFVVGGPVGAAVGAGVGGTVGAAAGDSNRAPPGSNTTVVVPESPAAVCSVDAYGNRTCVQR